MSNRKGEKLNAFNQETSAEEVAEEIYGKTTELDTGRITAKPIPINNIAPDLRQPRRAIPTIVRGYWNGDPNEVASVLMKYQAFAEEQVHKKFNVAQAIKGQQALVVEANDESDRPLYAGFAKLVALAAAIYSEGLTNPITVVKTSAQSWQVETGERRWLAHHLLAIHISPKSYGKIPAREVDYDPYRQASENNSREGYNAIEMARQIAILIMEARTGLDGVKYDRFEDMVLAGECDRKFYAQVANGYIHKIPDGLGDKIVNATGLSIARISQYRALLRLTDDEAVNDEIWIEADTKAWTENYIRHTVLPSLKPQEERLTGVNHSEDEMSSTAVEHSDLSAWLNQPVIRNLPNGTSQPGIITSISNREGFLNFLSRSGDMIEVHHSWLSPADGTTPDNSPSPTHPQRDAFGREYTPPPPSPFTKPKDHVNYVDFAKSFIGKHVRMAAGNTGKVTGSEGAYVLMVNDGSDLEMQFRVTEIVEVLPDTSQLDASTMDLTGKQVRLRNGIVGKVTGVYGSKLMFLKKGESIAKEIYRSAIASVITGIDDTTTLKVDDRVIVDNHGLIRRGVIRKVKDGGYNVYLDASQTTHWYEAAIVSPEPAAPPAKPAISANSSVIADANTTTLVQQLYLLAKIYGESEAESSLNLLMNASYATVQNMRHGLSKEDFHSLLEQHYTNISKLATRILGEVETVLSDIAAFDAAERQGE